MKKKASATVLVVILALVIVRYFFVGNPIIAVHNNQLKKAVTSIKDSQTVTLNEVVPFEWDTVYTFAPYETKENIEKTIGAKSSSIKETVSEEMVSLVFVKDNKVTASVFAYPSNLGYKISFDDFVSYEDNKIFAVENSIDQETNIIKLTLQ